MNKNKWPCPGKPEELKGQPIGMYHCEFCGEMQLAGVPHLSPQFPSQWEEPFPKDPEPPDYGPDESDMVSYPTAQVKMESIVEIGPPHTRPALVPPSSLPMRALSTCPVCGAEGSVTFTREEERFPYGVAPHTVNLCAVVDKGSCAACSFEFTDWRAENARDEAVKAHLAQSKP